MQRLQFNLYSVKGNNRYLFKIDCFSFSVCNLLDQIESTN